MASAPLLDAALGLAGANRLGAGLAGSEVEAVPAGLLRPANMELGCAGAEVAALVAAAGFPRVAKGEFDGAEVLAGAAGGFLLSVGFEAAAPKRLEGFAPAVSAGFAGCAKREVLDVVGAAPLLPVAEGLAPNILDGVEEPPIGFEALIREPNVEEPSAGFAPPNKLVADGAFAGTLMFPFCSPAC